MTARHTIGVIGGGPKAMYCLDHLAKRLEAAALTRPVDVQVYEQATSPGAGAVYDPTQPHYLRLNYANRAVDMWTDSADGPTLTEWLARHHPRYCDPDASAPRAVVGEYLHAGFTRIVQRLRAHATVTVHHATVTSVRNGDQHWLLTTTNNITAVDELLITVGHNARSQPDCTEHPRFVPSVYPLRRSGIDVTQPGDRVAIRGFGLTAIDAILALTEGRGGIFRHDTATGRYRYEPSGAEPARIYPYCRTGLAMTPKPALAIEQAPSHLSPSMTLDSLRTYLAEAGDRAPDQTPPARRATADGLRHAVDISNGRAPLNRDAVIGHAWRHQYPAIVAAAQNGRFDACWSAFSRLSADMERTAFGPPVTNAARLSALVDAGIVDLTAVRAPTITPTRNGFQLACNGFTTDIDLAINAVLPAHGVDPNPSPLLADLLQAGALRLRHGGVDIEPDGYAVGTTGCRTRGLAVIGRATHGSTIGNDTLSRTLHDHPRRWAETCLAALRKAESDAHDTA